MTSPSNLRDETSPCFPYLSKTFKIVVGFTFPMTFTVPCSASRTTEYTPFRFCNTSIICLLHPSQWTFTLIIQLICALESIWRYLEQCCVFFFPADLEQSFLREKKRFNTRNIRECWAVNSCHDGLICNCNQEHHEIFNPIR